MNFNINKYMGNYAMHCKTKEEAKIFCRYLDSVGRKWVDGTSYMSMTKWSVHGPDTCYDFCNGTYCNKTYFLTCYGYTILEFSDFEWDNKNTKRKPVIIYRNGQDVIALDKETGEKAVAKCHPNDEFDFAIGAKIAFGRLYHSQDYISEGKYLELVDNKDAKEINVGDRVKVIDTGCAYSSYTGWVTKNAPEFAVHYMYCATYFDPSIRERIRASTFTVVAKAPHSDSTNKTLYLVQDKYNCCFLFGEEGLKKCD